MPHRALVPNPLSSPVVVPFAASVFSHTLIYLVLTSVCSRAVVGATDVCVAEKEQDARWKAEGVRSEK